VIREVKEETDLEVEKPELIDVVDNVVRDERGEIKYHFVIIDYLVKLKEGIAKAASDAEELKWVALNDVEKHDLTPTFRAFFQRNKEMMQRLDSARSK
jgi:ADP-ribose pyrophosphatase YjhB (NUDIX family)